MKQIKNQRERDITRVSVVGIVSNGVLGALKILIGLFTGSIAIITDAVNNLADMSSSVITIIGTHLAGRRPDAKHPFGYGRVEYLTSLVIGLTVFFTGAELCRSSIRSIIHPDHVHYNYIAVAILVATIAVKLFLGAYTLAKGRKLDSSALVASGMDARSDAVATAATLVAALLYMWKGILIDAWVGAIISLYIVRTGFLILKDTVSKIVGESASKDLASQIRKIVTSDPLVIGAYDLILNNYGPDYYIGSMNVEIDQTATAADIYRSLRPLQESIYKELRTIIVFGIYAFNDDSSETLNASHAADAYVKSNADCRSWHGLFVDEKNHQVFCDVVAEYGSDYSTIREGMTAAIEKAMPGYKAEITVDTPFE